MKTTFNLGDLAILKSGSPVMTVEGQDKDKKILCVWFNKKGEKCSDSFFAETLRNSAIINAEEVLIPKEELSPEETSSTEEIKLEEAKVEEIVEQKVKKHQTKKHHNDEQPSVD